MSIKALFFDLDGLLLDTEKIYLHCWIKAAEELGYHLEKNIALQLRSSDSELARKIIEANLHDPYAYDSIRARRKKLMSSYIEANPIEIKRGVVNFFEVEELKKYRKYIITSAVPDEKLAILKENGIMNKIDKVITTGQVKRGKPYPDIYLYAMKEANVSNEECIAFEDSPNGVMSASNAGCKVVMIPDLTQPSKKLSKRCDYIIQTLFDFIQYLTQDKINLHENCNNMSQ